MEVKNLVLIGPPGSGKGTQARLLAERLNMEHLEAGDILRDYVATGGPRAAEINDAMQRGDLAPTDFLLDILKERIKRIKPEQGMIFDGYARKLVEAKAVEEMLAEIGRKLDKVFLIMVNKEKTIERISKRLNCKNCDASVILGVDAQSENDPCPKCGGPLFRREDDTPEKIEKRWETFYEQTTESIEYFRDKGLLVEINGDQTIEEVYDEIVRNF